MRMKKLLITLAAAGMMIPSFAFAAKNITIKGSDTMVILAQRWAEKYMIANSQVTLQVTGGGSGVGIAALINGTTDIATASRPMKADEKSKLRDRYQTPGIEIPVARDGLSVYLNESNPVRELSFQQLSDIYTGKILNWKEVGGPDKRITLYGRENSSGTYSFFKDMVLLGKDYAPQTQTLPGTAAVVSAVAQDPDGIGYGGAAYGKGIREASVRKDEQGPAVAPSEATVKDGTYPLTRYLFLYLRKKPAGDAQKFIDWVLSPEGQTLVKEVGYFPVQ